MRREKNDAPGYAAFSHYYDAYMSACDMKVWQAYLCAIEDKYGACAKAACWTSAAARETLHCRMRARAGM
jgi:hypothetical protein